MLSYLLPEPLHRRLHGGHGGREEGLGVFDRDDEKADPSSRRQ